VFLLGEIKRIYIGGEEVSKMYIGADLFHEKTPVDTVPPVTTARPAAGTFEEPITVWLDVNKPATTYYTTDGSEPTTNSTLYTDGIYLEETTTLRFFSVNNFGYAETPKSAAYTIDIPEPEAGWRYIRYQGFGDNTGEGTTRLIELMAMEGSTNHMSGLLPISGEATAIGTFEQITDEYVGMDSGTYAIWWFGAGIPTLVYDLGAGRNIDTMRVWMYSAAQDPRQTRFRLWVSKDNTNWEMVADYRDNTVNQSVDGWSFAVPSG
jgi:hypothetical protein